VWPQIVADASGRPVLALAQAEAPSLGAAILAGWGSGLIPHGSVPGAAAENVITPDPGTARVYDHVAERHRTALAALQPYWDAEAGAPPTDPTGAA
jgi:sugar (pentulose or hexulose) kinase